MAARHQVRRYALSYNAAAKEAASMAAHIPQAGHGGDRGMALYLADYLQDHNSPVAGIIRRIGQGEGTEDANRGMEPPDDHRASRVFSHPSAKEADIPAHMPIHVLDNNPAMANVYVRYYNHPDGQFWGVRFRNKSTNPNEDGLHRTFYLPTNPAEVREVGTALMGSDDHNDKSDGHEFIRATRLHPGVHETAYPTITAPGALGEISENPDHAPDLMSRVGARQYARPVRYSLASHEDFHRAIHAQPEEDINHLAYADWLQEQGHEAEANHIRKSVEQGNWWLDSGVGINDQEFRGDPPMRLFPPHRMEDQIRQVMYVRSATPRRNQVVIGYETLTPIEPDEGGDPDPDITPTGDPEEDRQSRVAARRGKDAPGQMSRRGARRYGAAEDMRGFHERMHSETNDQFNHSVYADFLEDAGKPHLASAAREDSQGGRSRSMYPGFQGDAEWLAKIPPGSFGLYAYPSLSDDHFIGVVHRSLVNPHNMFWWTKNYQSPEEVVAGYHGMVREGAVPHPYNTDPKSTRHIPPEVQQMSRITARRYAAYRNPPGGPPPAPDPNDAPEICPNCNRVGEPTLYPLESTGGRMAECPQCGHYDEYPHWLGISDDADAYDDDEPEQYAAGTSNYRAPAGVQKKDVKFGGTKVKKYPGSSFVGRGTSSRPGSFIGNMEGAFLDPPMKMQEGDSQDVPPAGFGAEGQGVSHTPVVEYGQRVKVRKLSRGDGVRRYAGETTEESFQQMLDANPDDHQTRMILADFLEERGDPGAAGYRALGTKKLRGESYRNPRFATGWTHEGNERNSSILYPGRSLPPDWWALVDTTQGTRSGPDTQNSQWWKEVWANRREAEDAAALAFSNLPTERQHEIMNPPADTTGHMTGEPLSGGQGGGNIVPQQMSRRGARRYARDINETIRQGHQNSRIQGRGDNPNTFQDAGAGAVLADALDETGQPHAPFFRNLIHRNNYWLYRDVPETGYLEHPTGNYRTLLDSPHPLLAHVESNDGARWSLRPARSEKGEMAVYVTRSLQHRGAGYPRDIRSHEAIMQAPHLREWAAHPSIGPGMRRTLVGLADHLDAQPPPQKPTLDPNTTDMNGNPQQMSRVGVRRYSMKT